MDFKGSMVALITPLKNGKMDYRKYDELIELHVKAGTSGIIPCSTTGESATLTHASRNGIPLELVSNVFLRHQDIKTTQMHLGKVTDTETIRWMDVLHGN